MDPFQLTLKAAVFAAERHRDQRRKDEYVSPYINHPLKVAQILTEHGDVRDPEVLASALLHDVLEDTATLPEELERDFGPKVRHWVEEVTDLPNQSTDQRREEQVARAGRLSPEGRMIKIADKISNVYDRTRHAPSDATLADIAAYLTFAERVVKACAGTHSALEKRFFEVLSQSKKHMEAIQQIVRSVEKK